MSNSESASGERSEALPARRCTTIACGIGRELKRKWRCLRRRWSSPGVRFIYDSAYRVALAGVPLDPLRADRVLAFLTEEGLVDRDDIVAPRPVSMRNLLRVHTPEYLEAVQDTETVVRIFGVPASDEIARDAVKQQRRIVGGTLQASRLARRTNGVVVNLGGGLHHAYQDSGMGFCIFNDIAVAIARLRARGFRAPILIVDLDMHDGNGTRSVFANDSSVHTYSIHNEHWGETDVTEATSIALGDGVEDEHFLGTLLKTLPPLVETFQPGMVFYLAATDGAGDDALGNWNLTKEGLSSRDRFVFDLFRRRERPVPMVVVLGGGYGERSWRYTARFMAMALSGRVIEPPRTEDLTLARLRRITSHLDPASLTSDPGDYDWNLTAEDLVGIVPGAPRRTRFLNHFSDHGIELALERFGILDRLRLLGFEHPTIDIDLEGSIGDTLRVWSRPDREELLIELRLDRSRRVASGFEVLVVEWLLLQNPRAEFGPYRRPLSGQKFPGLGLLKEVFGFLVMMCEMLELDGIYYVPSSYHVAVQSRALVKVLDPADEARFRAMRSVLKGMPLAQASKLIADGGVLDAQGEPVEWRGIAMVLPFSEELSRMVGGAEYETRVEDAAAGVAFSLAPKTKSEERS
ncbi:MAG: histone deacetylase [Thermoanaerobaculales bacterium]|nr:histone deacetylase [Thermoanaerobaculales bacterium]